MLWAQVFQRIDILSKDFDNIAELELGVPWPLPPVEVTATLAHKFELIGWCFLWTHVLCSNFYTSQAIIFFAVEETTVLIKPFFFFFFLLMRTGSSNIKIIFEKTTVKTTGNLSQLPPLELPRFPDALRPPSDTRSGEFEVTYLDNDTRITRGDRGELRVFVIT